MWTPDMRTLFLILFLVNVFLTLMLFSFWKTQKTYDGFKTWMLSLLIISCGYFLFMINGSVPVLLSTTVADLLIALAVMMRLDSIRRYFSLRSLSPIIYSTLIPSALLFLYFTFRVDSVVIRGVIIGLLIVPCFLATSFIAIRFREPETRSLRYGFAAALFVTALLWAVITVVAIITPGDHSLSGPDPINPIFFIVTILMDIVSTGSFLMLNMARSQTDLRKSEERYRNLANNLPDYILIHDKEFIRYANPTATRLMEPSQETLVGQSIYSFQTAASAKVSRAFINGIRSGDSSAQTSEIDLQLRDGTIRHCLIKTVPIDDNGIPAFLSVITDITDRKVAENALSQVNKKLTILSSITRHDINNQIFSIKAFIELSKETPGDTERRSEYLLKEEQAANAIEHQIAFMNEYEDIGVNAPSWQGVDACIKKVQASLPMRSVRIIMDCPNVEVFADPLFEKVFYNLIDNALRYGSLTMTIIRVASQESDQGLIISVEDDGVGISAEDKKHLFERGFGHHTGLGLFLSREILSMTGITIRENGIAGKGSRFEMTVPKGAYRIIDNR
jgi:PAS domain S-box-containing protein